jgi:hypothetical protein
LIEKKYVRDKIKNEKTPERKPKMDKNICKESEN